MDFPDEYGVRKKAGGIPKSILKDIRTIVDYNWDDEKRHYSEGRDPDHIFMYLKRVDKWLDEMGE